MKNIFFKGKDSRNEVKKKEYFFACTVCKFGAKAWQANNRFPVGVW